MHALDVETKRQIDELNSLLSEHERRLFVLRKRAAQMGRSTPAEVETEIRDIEETIQRIGVTVTKLYISAAKEAERNLMGNPIFDGEDDTSIEKRLSALGHYITQVEDALRREIAGIYHILDVWQSSDSSDRSRRQKRLDYYFYTIIFLFIILIIVAFLR